MTTTPRTLSETERRQQILAAARAVFNEKGYEDATVSDIVKRAGVAQGTFYLYFPSKKRVVIELARKPMEDVAARLAGVVSVPLSFEESLRGFIRVAFDVSQASPDLCRLIHLSMDPSDADMGTMEVEIRGSLVAMLRRAVTSGEMEPMDPDVAADMFQVIMRGALGAACAIGVAEGYHARVEETTTQILVNAFVKRG